MMECPARIIGGDAGLREVVQLATRLARVDATVLVCGETGVGKEVFARAIHDGSRRRNGPFVALNCGGLSRELLASELFGYVNGAFTGARRSGMPGKIEAAEGGTLFLDEITELPLDLQPYLLRVLDDGEVCPLGSTKPRQVHFRLISACNRELRNEVAEGRFRMDLFYRLSVTSLKIPALRHRRMDIPALVEHFAETVAGRYGTSKRRLTDGVLQLLTNHSWPGNVRELRNVVETITVLSAHDVVDLTTLPRDLLDQLSGTREPAHASATLPVREATLGRVEKDAISAAIVVRQGNLTQVARDLNISRSTLYLKVKKHCLDPVLDEARLGA
jgi:sigma-54 dependent transcriptional regulator, acetoin dehydrogenase operon transcriptional activator AcoR